MRNRSHTIEEESFFPSITDLMVGIIFIFIIIVMSLVLQIKDRQKIIPTQLLEKMVNLSDQEMTEVEVMIDNKDDFNKTVKDLATEKNINRDLKIELEEAKKIIIDQVNKIESFEELEIQNEILIKDINNSKNTLSEYQKEINNLSLQLTVIKEKDLEISILENTITNNDNEISILEKDITQINVNNAEKDIEISNLEKTITNLENDISVYKKTITNNIKEISILEKDIVDVNADNTEKDLEISILKDSIKIHKKEIINYQNIVSTNKDTDTLIKDQLKTISQLENKLDQLENDLKAEVSKYNNLNSDNIKIQNDNKTLNQDLLSLKNDIDNLKKSNVNDLNDVKFIVTQISNEKKNAIKGLLDELQKLLKKEKIDVSIDHQNSKLILNTKKMFSSAMSKMLPDGERQIIKLTKIFTQVLPCFSYEPIYLKQKTILKANENRWKKLQKTYDYKNYCNSKNLELSKYFKINTLMIEGHTDQDNSKITDEGKLSSERAFATFRLIRDNERLISGLTNQNGDPIFGYGGYGRTRPLIENAKSEVQRSKNRRIEFRFLLGDPSDNFIIKLLEEKQKQ